MKQETLLISNIQRFSLHDGPGIRTTVFRMGCPLGCPWCANPENQKAEIRRYVKDGREGTIGRRITAEALVRECLKDRAFYEPGGVTFSGGEPLLHMEALIPVCEALRQESVHLAAETSLYVSAADLEQALEQIDLFLVDVKLLKAQAAEMVEGGDLSLYLANLERLMHSDKEVILRIPLIAGYTDGGEQQEAVRRLIATCRSRIKGVELLEGHDLGADKYRALGLQPAPDRGGLRAERMTEYLESIKELGVQAELYRI